MAFKWTSPRTWVAGEVVTAANMNAHVRDNLQALNGFVLKTADETVTSSTTFQADDALTFSIPQAGTYVGEVALIMATDNATNGDIQTRFAFPAGTLYPFAIGLDSSVAGGGFAVGTGSWYTPGVATASPSGAVGFGLTAAGFSNAYLKFVLVATGAGSVTLEWAQSTSSTGSAIVKAGSHMTVKQVA